MKNIKLSNIFEGKNLESLCIRWALLGNWQFLQRVFDAVFTTDKKQASKQFFMLMLNNLELLVEAKVLDYSEAELKNILSTYDSENKNTILEALMVSIKPESDFFNYKWNDEGMSIGPVQRIKNAYYLVCSDFDFKINVLFLGSFIKSNQPINKYITTLNSNKNPDIKTQLLLFLDEFNEGEYKSTELVMKQINYDFITNISMVADEPEIIIEKEKQELISSIKNS